MLAERERRRSVILPEHEPANPSRRSERVFSHALTSPQRRTEERTRSVSVGRDLVKQEASQYLTQQYTNADAQQICQVCKDELCCRGAGCRTRGRISMRRYRYHPHASRGSCQLYPQLADCPQERQEGHLHSRFEGI